MNKYSDLKKHVPNFVLADPLMDKVYVIQGKELDNLLVNKDDVFNQLYVATATWGLSKWEDFLGIPFDIRKSEVERRNAIKSRIMGTGVFTIKMLKEIATLFGYTIVFIQENVDPYTVKIKLTTASDFIQVRSFIASIEDIKPAHISCIYLYNLSTWGDLESSLIDYQTLKEYKWKDFTLSGLGNGAAYSTNHLKLKQWDLSDVFLYTDLNYDFTKIDGLFHATTGHTHNGTDSAKIDSTAIKYDDTKTAFNRIQEINSLAADSASKAALVSSIGSPAVNTDTLAALATRITTGKTSIANALKAKGQTTASASNTFQQFADMVKALVGTVLPEGTAQPYEVKVGKTFVNSAGKQVGTMVTRTDLTLTPTTHDIDISGYQDGTCKIKGDPNLVGANIRAGVSIFGVSGTITEPDYVVGEIIPTANIQVLRGSSGEVTGYKILS